VSRKRKILFFTNKVYVSIYRTQPELGERSNGNQAHESLQFPESFSFRQCSQGFRDQWFERVSLCRSLEALGTSAQRQ